MLKLLIVFAHPALERSRVNRRLVEAIGDLEGVAVHDLYEAYPEFDIDVRREQELLAAHDVIVLQHPFYWYSAPAILKEWQDLVLEHGWAYGRNGTALRGKSCLPRDHRRRPRGEPTGATAATVSRSASCWPRSSRPRGCAAWSTCRRSSCTAPTCFRTRRSSGHAEDYRRL